MSHRNSFDDPLIKFPRMDAQTKLYTEIYDAARGKPVVFRTLDIGGDKLLPAIFVL